jgi:hypothetical protein
LNSTTGSKDVRFDLKKPCKHCPFADTADRITFACRERAEEIEEIAYREGFVCHKHSEYREDHEGFGSYHFGDDGSSQHCFGALAMYIKDGGANVPWEHAISEDSELEERWWSRADPEALKTIFDDEDSFLDANT